MELCNWGIEFQQGNQSTIWEHSYLMMTFLIILLTNEFVLLIIHICYYSPSHSLPTWWFVWWHSHRECWGWLTWPSPTWWRRTMGWTHPKWLTCRESSVYPGSSNQSGDCALISCPYSHTGGRVTSWSLAHWHSTSTISWHNMASRIQWLECCCCWEYKFA